MALNLGELTVMLSANTASYNTAMKSAETTLGDLSKKAAEVGRTLSVVGGAAFAAVALEARKAIKSFVEYGEQIDKLVKSTGASAETIARLGYAAKQEHASMEALAGGLKYLARNLNDFSQGIGQAKTSFERLGVTATDSQGNLRKLDDVLLEVADKFRVMPNETEKAALAMEIFGRSGIELVPFLSMGREEIARLGEEAERAGIVLSGDTVKSAKALSDLFTQLSESTRGVHMALGEALAPAMADLVQKITPVINSITEWIRANPELAQALVTVAGALSGVIATVGAIGIAIGPLAAGFAALTSPIGLVSLALGALVAAGVLVYQNWDEIKAAAVRVWEWVSNFFESVLGKLKSAFLDFTPAGQIIQHWDEIKAAATTIWNGIKSFFFSVVLEIKNKFKAFEDIRTSLEDVWNGVKKTVHGVWSDIVSGVKGYINAIIAAINGMIRAINKIGFSVPDWIPVIGGKKWSFNVPEIPLLQKGGIIPGYGGGDTVPAMLERGEAIVPADVVRGGLAEIISWFQGQEVARYQAGFTPAFDMPRPSRPLDYIESLANSVLRLSLSVAQATRTLGQTDEAVKQTLTWLERLREFFKKFTPQDTVTMLYAFRDGLAQGLSEAGNAWADFMAQIVGSIELAIDKTTNLISVDWKQTIMNIASYGLNKLGQAIADLFGGAERLRRQYPGGAYGVVNYPNLAEMRRNYEQWNENFQALQQAQQAQAGMTVGGGLLGGIAGFLIGGLFGMPWLGALIGGGLGAGVGYAAGQATYGQTIEDLKKKLEDTFQKIAEMLGTTISNIAEALGSAFTADTYQEFLTGFAQNLESVVKQGLVKAFMAGEVMRPLLQGLSDFITAAVWDGTLDAAEKLQLAQKFQEIVGVAAPFWEALSQFDFVEAVGGATEALGEFSEALRNAPTGFKIATMRWDVALPAYQEGGTVGRTGVALLHAGETVVPAGESGGIHIHLEGATFYGDDDFERKIVAAVSKAARRAGLTRHGLATGVT